MDFDICITSEIKNEIKLNTFKLGQKEQQKMTNTNLMAFIIILAVLLEFKSFCCRI